MKQIFNNDSGVVDAVNIMKALVMIVVIGAVGVYIADQVVTTSGIQEASVAASGALSFSGNVTTGELVNITSGSVYTFEFNTSGTGTTVVTYINVDVSGGNNTSLIASGKLTDAINANATVAAILTAVNTTNTTTATAVTAGTAGNSVGTTDNTTNAAWAAATLTGGLDASSVGSMQSNILSAGETGSSFLVILVIAFIGAIAISYLGFFGKSKK